MSKLFSHTLGKIFLEEKGAETQMFPGDRIKVVDVAPEGDPPQDAIVIERAGKPLWFLLHSGAWATAWFLGNIDAPDLFMTDVLQDDGLTIEEDGEGGWVVR